MTPRDGLRRPYHDQNGDIKKKPSQIPIAGEHAKALMKIDEIK